MVISRCCTISGIRFMICGGWLECLFTHSVIELSFLKGRYDLSVLLNVTSRKSTTVNGFSIVILRPSAWKTACSFLRICSVDGPSGFSRIIRPASWYRPTFSIGMNVYIIYILY